MYAVVVSCFIIKKKGETATIKIYCLKKRNITITNMPFSIIILLMRQPYFKIRCWCDEWISHSPIFYDRINSHNYNMIRYFIWIIHTLDQQFYKPKKAIVYSNLEMNLYWNISFIDNLINFELWTLFIHMSSYKSDKDN